MLGRFFSLAQFLRGQDSEAHDKIHLMVDSILHFVYFVMLQRLLFHLTSVHTKTPTI